MLKLLQEQPAPHPPVEELPGSAPLQSLANDALRLHAASPVVKIGKLTSDLSIQWRQLLLAGFDLRFNVLRCTTHFRRRRFLQHRVIFAELWVQSVHHFLLLRCPELDLYDSRRFKNASSRIHVSIHLHLFRVDGGIDHNPRTSSQLPSRRNVHENRAVVLHERVHDLSSKFENFLVHVTRAPGEATPICKNDQGKVLPAVEVPDGCSRLEGAVRKPHLPGLGLHHLLAGRVGRIRRDLPVHVAGFHSNHAHGNSAQLCPPHNDALSPTSQVLFESSLIKESRELASLRCCNACEHVSWVIRCLRGDERNITRDRVQRVKERRTVRGHSGHKRQPIKDRCDPFRVI
mmetsp:Transcript_70231/g.164767  ORF Transcript_70231/g.164767 Transcript_70231/m.164767 type:complete len:346 (-) Transcript_70231:5181-6218(-)